MRIHIFASLLVLCACHAAKPTAPVGTGSDSARLSCQYDAGSLPRQTLAASEPFGTAIPIDHIILLMQENRSFDHYFSALTNGADVASPTATNPDLDGGLVQRYHQPKYCFDDTNHEWDGTHLEIDDGGMDGFVQQNAYPDGGLYGGDMNVSGDRAMGYYDDTDLPFYYDLAETFSISDRHFCSAPGNTSPNRVFFAAATTRGCVDVPPCFPPTTNAAGVDLPNFPELLDENKVDWKFYMSSTGAGPEFASIAATDPDELSADTTKFEGMSQFFDDLDAGTLPSVSWVDIGCCDDPLGNNEHPSADMQVGQHFVSTVVQALMASSVWAKSALFLTWDEHGGEYDHVVPPVACAPDDYAPVLGVPPDSLPGGFNMYGPRVPLIVVSPYAKRGHVSHVITDHTSLLRFVEARFNLPALTRRDANATPPFDMFDFAHPDTSVPTLKEAVIAPAGPGTAHPECSPPPT